MGENSAISWTDHTFNGWMGCTKVADGCANCYAASEVTRYGKAKWGPNGTRVVTSKAYWDKPRIWNTKAEAAGVRERVFCASWADIFEDWQGDLLDSKGDKFGPPGYRMADLRRSLFTQVIDKTTQIDWLLLTKRPENIRWMWPEGMAPRQNIWLGTSIATQADADRNLPHLVACRDLAPVLFVSAEPLLGPIDLTPWLPQIDWVIAGGESGPHARPMYPRWPERLQEQCSRAGVAFHFKQWGEWLPDTEMPQTELRALWTEKNGKKVSTVPVRAVGPNGWETFSKNTVDAYRVGKQRAGRLLNKQVYDEFPP